jgi:hypothetical protein
MTTQSDRGLREILSQAHVLCGLVRIGMECHQEAVDLDEMIDRYETRPVPAPAEVSVIDRYTPRCYFGTGVFDQMAKSGSGEYVKYSDFTAALKAQKGVGWIACNEQSEPEELPETFNQALTFDEYGSVRMGYRVGTYWYQRGVIDGIHNPRILNVTHWRPLPTPPNESQT